MASQVTLADRSALLEHAMRSTFQPFRADVGGTVRPIFHLAITAGNRSRERAINDPFETSQLTHPIALTRRAMRDRQVLLPDMSDGVQFAVLVAAWLDARSANPGNDPSC